MNNSGTPSYVPVYQTLTPWDLARPGGDAWRHQFPFSAPSGIWAFSGRVALHLGLPKIGLASGSTILVPNYFQGVEIDTLLHNGYSLRFYRVDSRLKVDLDHVRELLDDKVGALYVIHYFGWPQDMPTISAFCREHELKLVEDCALSLFSRDENDWLGSYGDLSIYSVYKSLSLPHGGFLVCPGASEYPALARPPVASTLAQVSDLLQQHLKSTGLSRLETQWRRLAAWGKSRLGGSARPRVTSGGASWEEKLLDYGTSRWTPYLMRLIQPDQIIARRRANYQKLHTLLEGRVKLPLGDLPDSACPLFFPVLVDDKLSVMQQMEQRGVKTVNLWWDSHSACPDHLSQEVDGLRRHILELPIHQSLDEAEVAYVAAAFLEVTGGG